MDCDCFSFINTVILRVCTLSLRVRSTRCHVVSSVYWVPSSTFLNNCRLETSVVLAIFGFLQGQEKNAFVDCRTSKFLLWLWMYSKVYFAKMAEFETLPWSDDLCKFHRLVTYIVTVGSEDFCFILRNIKNKNGLWVHRILPYFW